MQVESKYNPCITWETTPPLIDVSISQSESRSVERSNSPPKMGCCDWVMAVQSPDAILPLRSVFY